MTVIDKHRIIKESWTLGVCENCGHNPKKNKMAKEGLVSGDPAGKYKSDYDVWVCPKCGYTRRL